jgi:biotin carboxylase
VTFLCLAGYEKGHEFLREAKRQGVKVVLLTGESLKNKAEWPTESINEIFYMPDGTGEWNRADTVKAVSYLARTRDFDRIVALDDFDVEIASMLREHLRVPGMGETTVRYFRDKLAMRMKAAEAGIRVPPFVHVLNYDRVRAFMEQTAAPWLLKPRMMAGAIGIKKIHSADELWQAVEALGDAQSNYLLEQFVPGDVFHVDTIIYEREVLFSIASGYGRPPMEVSHQGGVFTTRILERDTELASNLRKLNAGVMEAFGMVRGVSHTEFIWPHDGSGLYFLETSARVGGAHIVDLVEAATGINLWAEWAILEIAGGKAPYAPPLARNDYAGLLVSLSKQERPDTSAYNDPEVAWRMDKPHHVGLIVKSPSVERVNELLAWYAERVARDFQAYLPPKERPSD